MPEIEDWIEEQLDAGYTAEEIKKSLVDSGYNPNLVDKVLKRRTESSTSVPRGVRRTSLILIFGGIFSIFLFLSSLYWPGVREIILRHGLSPWQFAIATILIPVGYGLLKLKKWAFYATLLWWVLYNSVVVLRTGLASMVIDIIWTSGYLLYLISKAGRFGVSLGRLEPVKEVVDSFIRRSFVWPIRLGRIVSYISQGLAIVGFISWPLTLIGISGDIPVFLIFLSFAFGFPIFGLVLTTGLYYNQNPEVKEMYGRAMWANVLAMVFGILSFVGFIALGMMLGL